MKIRYFWWKCSSVGAVLALAAGLATAQTTNQDLVIKNTLKQSLTSTATGTNATALGYATTASGDYSLAEGHATTSRGFAAHSEGILTSADASGSHAEGSTTKATNLHAHAEGYLSVAGGAQSHAEGEGTVADGRNSHAGGAYSRVQPSHTNAFIHAGGTTSTNLKQSVYQDTAHFERLHVFSPANNDSNSVLARWENDRRYATTNQGALANTALQTNSADARYVNASGDGMSGALTNDEAIYVTADTKYGEHTIEFNGYGSGMNFDEGTIYYGGESLSFNPGVLDIAARSSSRISMPTCWMGSIQLFLLVLAWSLRRCGLRAALLALLLICRPANREAAWEAHNSYCAMVTWI